MLLHNILIFFFLFSSLHSPPLSLSHTLSFSCSFLFSKSSLFLFKFLTQILFFFFPIFSLFLLNFFFVVWGSLLLPCGCGCGGSCHRCGCDGSLTSWSCCGYGGSSVSSHAMGVGLCHSVRGSCCGGSSVLWFCGSCMPWGLCGRSSALCQAVGVGCRGFYFCGCG